MPPHPIAVAITPVPSFIADNFFIEQIPSHYVEQLSQNDCLQEKWDLHNYSQKVAANLYLNEKIQLKTYLTKYSKKLGGFKVKYIKPTKYGRSFPQKSLGITSFAKKTRNTLIRNLYYDFDLKNAQPELLRCICKANDIPCETVEKYCQEREGIIAEIMTAGGERCTRDLVKSLIIRLSFGGSFDRWLTENDLPPFPEPLIVKNYRLELATITVRIIKENLEMYKAIKAKKEKKGEDNINGSFMSSYLQEWELRLVENVLKHLCSNTKICETDLPNHFLATYEFDGLKLLKERVDEYDGAECRDLCLLQLMNRLNQEMGFDLVWEIKPIEKFYDITFIAPVATSKSEEREREKERKAEEKKQKFIQERTELETKHKDFIAKNDLEAGQMIYKKIKDNIKYSNGIMYYKHNYLWISNYEMVKAIVGDYIRRSGIRRLNDFTNKIEDYVQNRRNGMNVLNDVLDIATKNFDNDWTKTMFSSSLGKILFTNGYYDFHKGRFFKFTDKEFDHTIIFIEQIPHDYIALTDETYITSVKRRLFIDPFGEDVAEYYILNIARGLAGDVMKRVLFCIGDSNTGKSSITASIDNACGGYCGTFNANNIITKKMTSGDDAQQMRWVMMLLSKRLIISNEIESDAVINGTMLKKLSSGGLDKVVARGHSKNETEFKIAFLPMIFANDIDKISPMDDAVVTRVRAIEYKKVYVENPENEFELKIDMNFKNEIETYKFRIAFMMLLMQSYKKFMDGGRIEYDPPFVKKALVSTFGKIESYVDKLKEDFEITNDEDEFVESARIQEWIKQKKLNISITKLGRDINKYAALKKYDNVKSIQKKIEGKTRHIWTGIKEINDSYDF
tara:strand:+ start:2617 stop:5163 length:2547 start_codon:yes stop_codon:yes gene_type:complete